MKRLLFALISILLIFGCENNGSETVPGFVFSDQPIVDPEPIRDEIALPIGYEWQQFNNLWYSLDGCTFDGYYVVENATILKNIKSYTNVFIFAGRYNDGFTDSIYLINCQMGYLWKFTPSYNILKSNVKKLFITDGQTQTGIDIKVDIFPEIIGDELFYTVDGIEYSYNFLTKVVTEI